jgi:gentisate 1,2-dioxygenase
VGPETVVRTAGHEGARKQFYGRIDGKNLTPLWEVLASLVTPTPRTPLKPWLWRYADVKPDVLEAGRLISADEAERRVLILENPALRGYSGITQTLYAGLQLVMPGEVARAHRHSQSALRLVIDGEGAYTTVDGERRTMKRGDFILTPRWTWHDHGNLGDQPVIWMDGLDIPLVRMLDASFAEHGRDPSQTEQRPEGDNMQRFGRNMLPVDYRSGPTDASPLFVYPYDDTRASLTAIAKADVDPHLGYKMRYINPATGQSPMPTIGAFSQLLPAGMETRGYQCSDGTIYLCLEGEGSADIGGEKFSFAPNDIFVVPSWATLRLHARRETILFSYSDRPIQQALGLWRDLRSN